MKKANVYMFIDALGWEIVSRHHFLEQELPNRYKVKMQFGYSSAAIPTILSGEHPDEHGHFSFFYYDPKNSPFKFFKYLKYFFGIGLHPKCLFNRGRVRRHISKWFAKLKKFTGYFNLYSVPFEKLPYLDYCEKFDIWAKDGLAPVKNLKDILEDSGLKYHISNWRNPEAKNVLDAIDALKDGSTDFAFIYSGDFDAFMHDNVFDEVAIAKRLRHYEQTVKSIISTLKSSGRDFDFTVISDHGMTATKSTYDLMKEVESIGLKFGKDYISLYDSTMLRLWYLSEGSKERIQEKLNSLSEVGKLVSQEEKVSYGINFKNAKFGQDIFLTNEGIQIEPCDLGSRALKGMHGYSPEAPDSYAAFLSTKRPNFIPLEVKDYFPLMAFDIKNS